MASGANLNRWSRPTAVDSRSIKVTVPPSSAVRTHVTGRALENRGIHGIRPGPDIQKGRVVDGRVVLGSPGGHRSRRVLGVGDTEFFSRSARARYSPECLYRGSPLKASLRGAALHGKQRSRLGARFSRVGGARSPKTSSAELRGMQVDESARARTQTKRRKSAGRWRARAAG